jgi:hypothetical protein
MSGRTKTALIFDISWFASFIFLQSLPFFVSDAEQHQLGFFSISCLIGGVMLFSKKLKSGSIVGKMLHWFAINVMTPRSEYNHRIWGLFVLTMGVLSAIFPDKPSKNELDYFQKIQSSPEYLIGIIAILVLNILVGVYTAKKYKNH